MIIVDNDSIKRYFINLGILIRLRAGPNALVPRWGKYIGNGPNDAWNKADAAIRTWPELDARYALRREFPRSRPGALAAVQALRLLANLEKRLQKGHVDDPLQVDTQGSPEEEAALRHDFALSVAVQTHDLIGELNANNQFAQSMNKAGDMRAATGHPIQANLDYGAAKFIGYGANGAALNGAAKDQARRLIFGRSQP